MQQMVRALLALGAAAVFAGCEGADWGVPEDANVDANGFVELPDYSHEYLVQPATEAPQAVTNAAGETVVHADPAVLFRGTELDRETFKVDDISTEEQDAETLKHPTPQLEWHPPLPGGVLGQAQQPIFMSLFGPGFQLSANYVINSRNTGQIIGPCYEDTQNPIASNRDCEVPNFTIFNTPWAFDIQLNQQFCTMGVIGGPPGTISVIGDGQFNDAFNSWKASTGVPFVNTSSGSGELISVICAPAATQNSSGQGGVLASGGPWGFVTKRTDTTPKLGCLANAQSCTQPGLNYGIARARDLYTYGGGIMWIDDIHINDTVQSCSAGKTGVQRDKMKRTFAYAIALHEVGHIMGFWHAGSGPMKPTFGCADMGDGSAIFEPGIPSGYGTIYQLYSKALRGQNVGTSSAGPPPPLNHNDDDDQSQVFTLN